MNYTAAAAVAVRIQIVKDTRYLAHKSRNYQRVTMGAIDPSYMSTPIAVLHDFVVTSLIDPSEAKTASLRPSLLNTQLA